MDSSDVVAGTNATATQYNNLRADVINRQLAMAMQAVINGNFDIWQRNSTFTNPAHLSYTADRWLVSYQNSGTLPTSIIHSRQALTAGDIAHAFYHYRIAPNGAGSGFAATDSYSLSQKIEYGTRFLAGASKKVTVSFYARSSISGKKLGLYLVQRYGSGGSPTSGENINGTNWTLTSSWTKYSYTFDLNTLVGKTFGTNNDDSLEVSFMSMWGASNATLVGAGSAETFVGSGNIDIAQVQVNSGSVAMKFWPKTFGEELQECQRYFCKSYAYDAPPATVSDVGEYIGVSNGNTNRPIVMLIFPVRMRTIPTLTTYSPATGTSGKCRNSTTGADKNTSGIQSGDHTYSICCSEATSNNDDVRFHFAADAEL